MSAVDQLTMKVQRMLIALNIRAELTSKPNEFLVRYSDASTVVRLFTQEWFEGEDGEMRTLVGVEAPIVFGAKATPALFEWVAKEGGHSYFGHVVAFSMEKPDQVSLHFRHTLLGNYLDQEELKSAVLGVLAGADELDDIVKKKFGGQRVADL